MRRTGAFGVALFASALSAFVLAGSAWAKLPLIFKNEGANVSPGTHSVVKMFFNVPQGLPNVCRIAQAGSLETNGKTKDKLGFSGSPFELGCQTPEADVLGEIKQLQVTSTGAFSVKGKLLLTTLINCVYEAKKLPGTFTVPGTSLANGISTWKLHKYKDTPEGCLPTREVEYEIVVSDEESLKPFELET
jgi:hypothetical protein